MKRNEFDALLILKNQQVMMKALFEVMKTMAGNMAVAEEIKQQAKESFDYIRGREVE